jgi:hypothetical protein
VKRPLDRFDPARSVDVETARRMRFPSPGVQLHQGYHGGPQQEYAGGGPQLPPVDVSMADTPYTRLIFPPRIEKLPESRDFNVQNYALVIPAGLGSVVQGPSFIIPESQVGWLQNAGLYLLTPTALTSVTLIVRINEGPVPGFDNLQNAPGIANFVLFPVEDDMRVRIPNHAKVDFIIVNNNANGPWTGGGFLGGWYHPDSAELRQWGPVV